MSTPRFSEPSFHTLHYAMVLSDLRRSARLDERDCLGAMYVANMDRLSRYWREPGQFEMLALEDPLVGQLAARVREVGPVDILQHRGGVGGVFKPFTPQFKGVYLRAVEAAERAAEGQKPVVFPEHFLLAMAECADSELARRLISSGLRVEALRSDVERGIR